MVFKELNMDEINDLIKGIEDGDIIIGNSEPIKLTEEERKELKKRRQEHYNSLSDEEKQHIHDLSERFKNKDRDNNCKGTLEP